ncbi:MAG: hypothetical protein LBK53_04845 [Heliobacteriaceae bacterium]|jgi:hypothetical protein|nr:hypothetical protein [Heliobacteriaceae bacterium]
MSEHGAGLTFAHVITDIPIDIVLVTFIASIIYTIKSYLNVSQNLKKLNAFLSQFKKTDLSFRFREIDEWMTANHYVSHAWHEFKNTLVFSESVALKGQNDDLVYTDVSSTVRNVQTVVDPLYFFSDEALIKSKFNHKLIEQFPTFLTGCGPLFTFMNIIVAFGQLNFESAETILSSVAGLMAIMQIAALVSVIAVACSLIYIFIDKMSYSAWCLKPYGRSEELIGNLFDYVSSEKFLFELLKETKIQNNSVSNLVSAMPVEFKAALLSGIAGNVVPYLENVIFGVNQLNKNIKEVAKSSGGDDFF